MVPAGVFFAAALALLLGPLPWNAEEMTRGVYRSPEESVDVGIDLLPVEGIRQEELLLYRDGLNSTVSVHATEGHLDLRFNGKTDASTAGDMFTQVLSGQIPLLFGEPASRVLVIGLASGVTVGSVARHPVEQIDVVEIEPAMVEASHFFNLESGGPLEDPRVRIIIDDGRNYLFETRERYDVIISEPSNPLISGVSDLFTQEFFRSVRAKLKPHGRLLQWVQLYEMDPAGVMALLAAVRSEFPFAYGFKPKRAGGDLLVLATLEPLDPRALPLWKGLADEVRRDLARAGVHSTEDLWSLLRLLPEHIDELVGEAPAINTDRNLFIELRAPWTLYDVAGDDTWALLERFPAAVLPLVEAAGEPPSADRVGKLALSYARQRGDRTVASHLLPAVSAYGVSAYTLAARAVLGEETLTANGRVSRLDAAVDLRPGGYLLHLLRAEALGDAERYTDALEDLDEALALEPRDWRIRRLRAQTLHALGRLEEAATEFERLLAMSHRRRDQPLLEEAGTVYLAAGRPNDAVPVLERALELRPSGFEAWTLLADAYTKAGRPADARRAERNVDIAQRNTILWLHREARRALWRGARDEAIRGLRLTLALDPSYEAARQDLSHLGGVPPDLADQKRLLTVEGTDHQ
jgi:spermidine synthase